MIPSRQYTQLVFIAEVADVSLNWPGNSPSNFGPSPGSVIDSGSDRLRSPDEETRPTQTAGGVHRVIESILILWEFQWLGAVVGGVVRSVLIA